MGAFSRFITGNSAAMKAKALNTAPADPPPVIVNDVYSYAAGPQNLGVGVMNLALEHPGIPLDMNYYAPRYDIQGTLAPLEGGDVFPLVTSGTLTDLRANGVYLSGTMDLSGLTTPNDSMTGVSVGNTGKQG